MKRFIKYQLPAIIWMVLIFTLSSRQRIGVSEEYWMNFAFFKSLHVIEYAILYLLILRALASGRTIKKKQYVSAFVLTVLYAISDEMHQTFVPTREGTLRDVAIDTVGAFAAMSAVKSQKIPLLKYFL